MVKVISTELAKTLTNRKDRKDLERLKGDKINNIGVMMGGDLDIETGEIGLLAFPSPTHAYASTLQKTKIRERQGPLKRILDTGNWDAPDNCIHATVRDMNTHDRVLVALISTGCWGLKPMEALDEKVTEVRVAALIPFSLEFIARLEQEAKEMNIGELAGEASASRNFVAVSSGNLDFGAVLSMMANTSSIVQSMYDCTVPGAQPFLHAFSHAWTELMITSTARNWWTRKNSAEQRQNFLLFTIHSLDCLTAHLNEAGQDFGSHSAIEDNDITRVAKADYKVATIAEVEGLKGAKK